jgi:hypothetical protein
MNTTSSGGAGGLGGGPVDACTLPTAERPVRLAEIDSLFATTYRAVERRGDTHARLLLAGDASLPIRVRAFADAESACCSFFTFGVSTLDSGLVAFDIDVPPSYAAVLDGLVARAQDAGRGVS